MTEIRHILLVEDNAQDEELTLRVLAKHRLANHVVVARDGQEVLDYLFGRGAYSINRPAPPALILLDLGLPKINGLEVLRQIKADARLKNIPIVVITASRQEQDTQECHRLGIHAFVVKPMDFLEFVEAVKRLEIFWALVTKPPAPPDAGGPASTT